MYVSASISTKTGTAPKRLITSLEAIKVKGVVIISSPSLIPIASNAINRASVPLEQAIACLAPVYFAKLASNSFTAGPIIYCEESRIE